VTAWLYRLFDTEGAVLYVGISRSPSSRFMQHGRKQWWPEVAQVRLQRYATDAEAMDAEMIAVRVEQPRHNVRTDRWRSGLEPVPAPVSHDEALPVGALEVAGFLGVKRETVAMWKIRGLLPPARWVVSGEDAWDWAEDIEPWARQTGRLRS
jgi:predicted GIY-YIG superfamily endonuclease